MEFDYLKPLKTLDNSTPLLCKNLLNITQTVLWESRKLKAKINRAIKYLALFIEDS